MFKKIWRWWVRNAPHVLKLNQEVEVGIRFDLSKVSPDDLFEIQSLLFNNGIYFDTGCGYASCGRVRATTSASS